MPKVTVELLSAHAPCCAVFGQTKARTNSEPFARSLRLAAHASAASGGRLAVAECAKLMQLKEGLAVWVADPAIAKDDLFTIGHIVTIDGDKATVETEANGKRQEIVVPVEECHQTNHGADVPDHCQLVHLSQPTLLENTRVRFETDKIHETALRRRGTEGGRTRVCIRVCSAGAHNSVQRAGPGAWPTTLAARCDGSQVRTSHVKRGVVIALSTRAANKERKPDRGRRSPPRRILADLLLPTFCSFGSAPATVSGYTKPPLVGLACTHTFPPLFFVTPPM